MTIHIYKQDDLLKEIFDEKNIDVHVHCDIYIGETNDINFINEWEFDKNITITLDIVRGFITADEGCYGDLPCNFKLYDCSYCNISTEYKILEVSNCTHCTFATPHNIPYIYHTIYCDFNIEDAVIITNHEPASECDLCYFKFYKCILIFNNNFSKYMSDCVYEVKNCHINDKDKLYNTDGNNKCIIKN